MLWILYYIFSLLTLNVNWLFLLLPLLSITIIEYNDSAMVEQALLYFIFSFVVVMISNLLHGPHILIILFTYFFIDVFIYLSTNTLFNVISTMTGILRLLCMIPILLIE